VDIDHDRSSPGVRRRGPDVQEQTILALVRFAAALGAGGAYATGSGSHPLYDGSRLAEREDVVVVTLNHRLNVFGYAYLARLASGFEDSGNVGQLDLVLALRWVQENIAAFGGDPDRVMLFGQSGGGAKIATLMATPAAQGLFHRAATMSGQQVTASGPINATTRATAWLKALGLLNDCWKPRPPKTRFWASAVFISGRCSISAPCPAIPSIPTPRLWGGRSP
jgi:acetyl esterase/lipase